MYVVKLASILKAPVTEITRDAGESMGEEGGEKTECEQLWDPLTNCPLHVNTKLLGTEGTS